MAQAKEMLSRLKRYQEGGEVIGERTPYDSELKFFKENPNVGGMMAEDEDAIVMNPYSSLTKQELDAVRLNERARVLMRREGAPSFELTPKQQKMLSSMPFYKEATPEEQKATIAARVLSGDPSAGEPTEEQLQFVKSLRQKLDSMSGSKKMLNELRGYQEGGEVEMPEEQASPVTEAAKQMLFYKKTAAPRAAPDIARLGKQAGLIGLGFAPGAGVADYFGKFPAVEGGTEPSAVENFQKGNYGTAALQGLGAMGDLAMAVPVAGAAIGSVMKAPRAAQRILSSSTTAKDDLAKVLGYSEDIPNEKWLAGKVEDAVEGGTNSFGVPRRMGSTTGYFGKPVEVPVDLLAKLPGERGEQSNVRQDSLDYIRKNWDTVSKEPPYIEVDPFGKAWVSEGNHRIMVAKEKGLKTLPVEIRYFSGGQRNAGELAPEKILEYNLPSTTTAKEDLANVPGVLPKAEREKNLTENFKDSKAVDKEGKPIRLYHGTNQDINEFTTQPGAIRKKFYAGELGSWFGDDPKIANKFAKGVSYEKENGTVYPVFLNIKNPKVFDSYEEFMSVMKSRKSAPTVRKELIKQGYDGIQVKDSTTDFGGRRDDWVAFFPEQVKSATGNKGTYDTTKPDITKAKGGEVRKPK